MRRPKRIWPSGGYPFGSRGAPSRHSTRWWTVLLAVAVLTLIPVLIGLAAPTTEAAAPTKSETLRQELAAKQTELNQATSKLDALQSELDELAEQQNAIEVRLANLEEEIAEVESAIAESRDDLSEVRGILEERLVGLYKQSSTSWVYAELLIEGSDLNSVLDRLDSLSQIAKEDQRLFDEVESYLEAQQASKRLLQEKQAQQEADLLELSRVQKAASERFASAENTYKALKSQISRLKADIAKADAEAAAAAEAARKRAIQRMAWQQGKRWNNSAGGTIQPPPFTFPVDGPHSYINSWGYARSGGRTHKGADIMAARGTPLVACYPGVVSGVHRRNTGLGGITVHIKGNNGYVYYYAHLDSVASGVYVGMPVKGGTLVGYVGNSGNARGGACHLHFGMQPGGGVSVNPYATLRFYDD